MLINIIIGIIISSRLFYFIDIERSITWAKPKDREISAFFQEDIKAQHVPNKYDCLHYLNLLRYDLNDRNWQDMRNKVNALEQKEKRNR